LTLIVSGICQESLAAALAKEVGVLRQRVAEFRLIQSEGPPVVNGSGSPVITPDPEAAQRLNSTLVDSTLSYLHRHYQTPVLSLSAVAKALGCNPRYLTARFTLIVGERMRAYLVRLRVAHACRLLMDTNVSIKEAAYASGFSGNGGLTRAFRRYVGVCPSDYRRIFAAR
jgi:AraC-like DNA-binding protein